MSQPILMIPAETKITNAINQMLQEQKMIALIDDAGQGDQVITLAELVAIILGGAST